jgi:WhiB family transcriptional regulator, redox-sensing transcriptional regulator
MDSDVFFPIYDAPSYNAPAIAICDRCTVKAECLEWALERGEEGVWGGTGAADRRSLIRKRQRATCVGCKSEHIVASPDQTQEICLDCGLSWNV